GTGSLASLSTELADAVERAGRSGVRVEARRRMPGSGIVWPNGGVIVTADHVLERQEEISVAFAGGERVSATGAGGDRGSDRPVAHPTRLEEQLRRSPAARLLLRRVDRAAPAAAAGLMIGDALPAIDGRESGHPGALEAALGRSTVGKNVNVRVLRGGQSKDV